MISLIFAHIISVTVLFVLYRLLIVDTRQTGLKVRRVFTATEYTQFSCSSSNGYDLRFKRR